MLEKVWIFTIFSLPFVLSLQTSFEKTCPYPMPKTIEPCLCKVNEKFQIFLTCNINQDMDRKLFQKLIDAFAFNKEVHMFDINLNDQAWKIDFSPELLGQFKISYFKLSNFGKMEGDIQAGVFNRSSFSLKEFHIDSYGYGYKTVETGAFSKLQNLKKVSLGKPFRTIKTKAFYDLPNFQQLEVKRGAISDIEPKAFEDLPKLKTLDFSHQSIWSLSSKSFYNLPNLTELNLSSNNIRKIEANTFDNLPSLLNLDLSKNSRLCNIGNLFSQLQNPNLVVNLAENNINILVQDAFKLFMETVSANNGKGYINMSKNPLQCGCDVKWLANSSLDWAGMFQNMSCHDGIKLLEVDFSLHEKLCPPENYPGYDSGYGQMYQHLPKTKDSGILTSPGFPIGYSNWLTEKSEIKAVNGPIDISFSHFETAETDFVSITDGDGTVLLKASGNRIPRNMTSNTDKVVVEFQTKTKDSKGWQMIWQGQGHVNDEHQLCECCY